MVQAISAQDEKLSQTMFLPLAERMVEKMVKEEKIEAEAEVSRASASPPCCVVWMQNLRFRFRCLYEGSTSVFIIQVHFTDTARFHQTQICLKKLFCTSHSSVHPLRASSQIRKTPHKTVWLGKMEKTLRKTTKVHQDDTITDC